MDAQQIQIAKAKKKEYFHIIVFLALCGLGISKEYLSEAIYLSGLAILVIPAVYIIYTEFRIVALRGEFRLANFYPLTILFIVVILLVAYYHFSSFPFYRSLFSIL